MAFVFGLPRDAQGRTGILVFVDRFSKMVHLASVAASITAVQTAAIFVDTVYRHHGLPASIVSDRDPRFTAAFWSGIFKSLGTRLLMSTVAHPETDGQTERVNRVLGDVLRSYATSFTSWSSFLPMVEFAFSNAEHASTGLTPFYVNYGQHPRVPAPLGVESSHPNAIDDNDEEDAYPSASHSSGSNLPGSTGDAFEYSGDDDRENSHDISSTLLNGGTTRTAAKAAVYGVRTRAATRTALPALTGSPAPSVATRRHRRLPRVSRRGGAQQWEHHHALSQTGRLEH
ncbi:hypothetical protein PC116_g2375 [Phytophthora cactorum]|uniref:Uncharacterized protein n=2 Tax=Phytophthora cactorum TaxID=29920 RepID=A0A329T094_9STRA|nr:hypothetical protein PC116_g2375 [Phytophthora cactorum]RAW41738.1 hypothetical protein PC110_g2049 [Phytophthora cactorum]